MLSEFSKRKRLPENLEQRIKKFIENNHQEDLYDIDYKKLIDDLPAVHKSRIISFTHQDIIVKLDFFRDKE